MISMKVGKLINFADLHMSVKIGYFKNTTVQLRRNGVKLKKRPEWMYISTRNFVSSQPILKLNTQFDSENVLKNWLMRENGADKTKIWGCGQPLLRIIGCSKNLDRVDNGSQECSLWFNTILKFVHRATANYEASSETIYKCCNFKSISARREFD